MNLRAKMEVSFLHQKTWTPATIIAVLDQGSTIIVKPKHFEAIITLDRQSIKV
jgi:hypothetical protein